MSYLLELMHSQKRNRKKGFTLVEVIVVLVILAILASLMIPTFAGYIEKAKKTQVLTLARHFYTAFQTAISERYAIEGFGGCIIVKSDAECKVSDEFKGKAVGKVTNWTFNSIKKKDNNYKTRHNSTDERYWDYVTCETAYALCEGGDYTYCTDSPSECNGKNRKSYDENIYFCVTFSDTGKIIRFEMMQYGWYIRFSSGKYTATYDGSFVYYKSGV